MPEREIGELKLAVRNQLLKGWTHTPALGASLERVGESLGSQKTTLGPGRCSVRLLWVEEKIEIDIYTLLYIK